MSWLRLLLFLHILFAIVAFGPTFAFPFIGVAVGREPAHANFGLRLTKTIATRLVVPVGIAVLLTGLALIEAGNWNLLRNEWLLVALVLYLLSLGLSLGVQGPTVGRLIDLTTKPPAGPPPAELPGLVGRARAIGVILTVNLAVIVLLMVWKPGA